MSRSGILVGVDGSSCSVAAVQWAAREATMRNVPLTLVHVVAVPVTDLPILTLPATPIAGELLEEREEDAREELRNAIKVAEDTAVGNGRPQIKAEVMCSALAATLVKESKHAEMVVVGSRGQSAWHRALLGSVSTPLVRRCFLALMVRRYRSWPLLSRSMRRPGAAPNWLPYTLGMTPIPSTSKPWNGRRLNPRERETSRSAWLAGRSATLTSPFAVWSSGIIRPATFSTGLNGLSSSSSVAAAGVGSPECCWDQSVRPWSTQHAYL